MAEEIAASGADGGGRHTISEPLGLLPAAGHQQLGRQDRAPSGRPAPGDAGLGSKAHRIAAASGG